MKKKVINELKLVFDSDSRNESFARYAVSAFVSRVDPDTQEIADIRTALSEAVTNCIVHGYRGSEGKITVYIALYDDRSIKMTVTDKGCGIENIEEAKQPLFTTDQSGERGGMGLVIMESFCDNMRIRSEVGRGTSVTMLKRLK